MVITYYGKQYFKLTLGDLTIATNPPSKASKPSRFGADIALITTNIEEGNDAETVTLGEKVPFVMSGPGNYEIRDLLFTGAGSPVTIDGVDRINTIYGFELDGIKICFLGNTADEKSLTPEAKEIAGLADMIFVAVGNDPAHAYKLATSFDPNVVIPMDYDAESLKRFLKEGGQEGVSVEDKATLKRRDLDGKEGTIIALASQS